MIKPGMQTQFSSEAGFLRKQPYRMTCRVGFSENVIFLLETELMSFQCEIFAMKMKGWIKLLHRKTDETKWIGETTPTSNKYRRISLRAKVSNIYRVKVFQPKHGSRIVYNRRKWENKNHLCINHMLLMNNIKHTESRSLGKRKKVKRERCSEIQTHTTATTTTEEQKKFNNLKTIFVYVGCCVLKLYFG